MASGVLLAALSLAASLVAGETISVESATLEMHQASVEDLSGQRLQVAIDRAIAHPGESVWVAYEVASVEHRGSLCCGRGPCCNAEEPDFRISTHDRSLQTGIAILLRFTDGKVQRIRTVSLDCPVSFAGRRVLWAGQADPGESLDILGEWMESDQRRIAEASTAAVAMHASARAAAMLTSIVRQHPNEDRRQSALFWLGQTDADGAAETVYRAAMGDSSSKVARHAVFVLSQLDEPEGLTYLVRVLEQRERPGLRKEALFWIGQSSEPDALETVSRILNQ